MTRKKAALWGSAASIDRVYGAARLAFLRATCDLFPQVITRENLPELLPELRDTEAIFSTWGMFAPTREQFDALPNLHAVFYGAGSVQGFAPPFLERNITVVSAWAANAVPVAEFTLAQILLANKGYFRNIRDYTSPDARKGAFSGRGNFGATVAILGAGQIGRRVIDLLKPFQLNVVVFDPFLTDEAAQSMGVQKVTLEDAFSRSQVVSNHIANLPATVGMLTGDLIASLPPNATFINTGRGATVDEPGMTAVLSARPDVTALLDVTYPEPPLPDSPLWNLPNVIMSSHIAGAIGDEVGRLAEVAIEEFMAWSMGEPLRYNVTPAMLETMA